MKSKKIPLRKCVVTNEMRPKKELIRIVRNKEGELFVDPTGKQNGRGAYLILDEEIIKQARQTDVLNKQLQTKVPDEIFEELLTLSKEN